MAKAKAQTLEKIENKKVLIHKGARNAWLSKLLFLQKQIELPMLILSFVWLIILIAELVMNANTLLFNLGTTLWIIFIFYFVLRLLTVSNRIVFLNKNWLFITAILISLLRFFPVVQSVPFMRVVTATFGMQVIWIFASADQGMRSIRRALGHRGIGYVLALTSIVIFAGAAGIFHFEHLSNDSEKIQTYPKAVWWTAMQMTNIGSSYAFKTPGGKILCLAISIYAAAMFGYLTAVLASLFIDRDIKDPKIEIARQKKIDDLQIEMSRLSKLIEDFIKSSPAAPQKIY